MFNTCIKYSHHILGVPGHLLIPAPVYKEVDNMALEEVLVITFYLMAGQTSVIEKYINITETIILFLGQEAGRIARQTL